jgi:hypothetical protein
MDPGRDRGGRMLKISILESPAERTMVLEGCLMEPYISEIESAWRSVRNANPACSFIVDMRNVIFIDLKSEQLLRGMKLDGAKFIACGISTTHQLEQLGITCSEAASRAR